MENKHPIVVNLYGGPGSGKSTVAARIFSELKDLSINVELVTEFAKDLTWGESFNELNNQIYVFANQHQRLNRLRDKVDVIVTDSPLLTSLVYYKGDSEAFEELVQEENDKYFNIDIFLNRVKHYNPIGRNQTEEEARIIDEHIKNIFTKYGYRFDLILPGSPHIRDLVVERVKIALAEIKTT